MHELKIVFLDEPTGGVDPVTRRRFWDMIYEASERGLTIFVTTHYMDEAEYCDRLCIMVDGKSAALDRPEAMKQHYGAESMNEGLHTPRPTRKNGINGTVRGNLDRLRFFFLCQFDFQFAANCIGVFPQRGNRGGMLAAGFQSGDGTF